jgi:DinB family protein
LEVLVKFSLDLSIDILQRTPTTLQALLHNVGSEWARATEGPNTFSAFDVVGHLIDGEETDWIPRARIILSRGSSLRFEPYDRFRHWSRNSNRTLESLLAEFAELRHSSLEELRAWNLTDAELNLPGEHPRLGPVTLRQLFAAWVVHDLGHIAQAARVMAKQYKLEAGPWVPFLPVLTDHEVPRS